MKTLWAQASVVTMNGDREIIDDGAMVVENDLITDVGPAPEVAARHPDAQVIDCAGQTIIPGLVNTHTHLFQTLLKGLGDDMVLRDWFVEMTGPSAVQLTFDDVLAAARHGCVESIRSGVTTLVDFMYAHPRPYLADAVVQAFVETGIRGVVARGYITAGEGGDVPPELVENLDAALADASRLIGETNRPGGRVQVGLAPCMIWAVDERTLTATREVADAEHALITMHVSETDYEIANSMQRFGVRDVEVLERTGLLGPDLLAVHCVQCDERDIGILRAHGASVSHNPASNAYLASGCAPVPEMIRRGLTVGLATDGPASNNNHNLIQCMKFAALVHKGEHRDPRIITAGKVLEMATIDGARALGLAGQIGSLEAGKKADFAVLDLSSPFVTPLHNPVSALVYSALGSEPRTVVIDGVTVMADGVLRTVDEGDVTRTAAAAAHDLAGRAGTSRPRRWPGG
jgi:5-methylthioadenosine/S-adenosylhomocysteine deaminase